VTIHEAGLVGFWLHRVLQQERIDSHVVDAASIATSRRRWAKTDKTGKINGEALLRALLAFKRGESRALLAERIVHVNRIKRLLFAQGISDYAPLRRGDPRAGPVEGRQSTIADTDGATDLALAAASAAIGAGRKGSIVAVARKLRVALWTPVKHGVVFEGAVMNSAAWERRSPKHPFRDQQRTNVTPSAEA
jgi:transposase